MRWLQCAVVMLTLSAAPTAYAELKLAAADAVLVEHHYAVPATTEQVWNNLLHPEDWWPADHTWSGSAANLSLQPDAGGCFCERWSGSSVEHGRVIMVQGHTLLRIDAALGPLQDMAVTGVLTIRLTDTAGGSDIGVTYRVSATPAHQLVALADTLDRVVGQQFAGLAAAVSARASAP